MTLQEIDERLETWKNALAAADRNLMSLLGQSSYQCLAGLNGVPKVELTGTSASNVAIALQRVELFLEYSRLLQETVDRAADKRRRLMIVGNDQQKLREIEELLSGKSIRLPAIQTPPEQRALMRGLAKETTVTPSELLTVMQRTFEAAREVVLAVQSAWKKLSTGLDEGAAQIKEIENSCQKTGYKPPDELLMAKNWLEDLRATSATDPLGTISSFNSEITPILERVRAEAKEHSGKEHELDLVFENGHAMLQKLSNVHRESIGFFTEVQEKVTGCSSPQPPLPEEKIEALQTWLLRLESKRAEGIGQPLVIGMRNWNAAAQEALQKEQTTLQRNRAAIEMRNELRGRLDALQAKAKAYGLAEEPELARLASEAATLLYARPTPLDRADALVTGYKTRLSAHTMQAKS